MFNFILQSAAASAEMEGGGTGAAGSRDTSASGTSGDGDGAADADGAQTDADGLQSAEEGEGSGGFVAVFTGDVLLQDYTMAIYDQSGLDGLLAGELQEEMAAAEEEEAAGEEAAGETIAPVGESDSEAAAASADTAGLTLQLIPAASNAYTYLLEGDAAQSLYDAVESISFGVTIDGNGTVAPAN